MLTIRGIFIIHLFSICFATNIKKDVSFKTGNKLAVLKFEGYSISEPLTEHLTEEFRKIVRSLKIFSVQDGGITNEINIFYPREKNYWSCWSKECAVDIGKRLKVDYVITGSIQNNIDDEFLLNGRLFSIGMETLMNEFAINSSGITDSLLLQMKKLAYNISGLPVPDTLSVYSDTMQVDISEKFIRGDKIFQLPYPKILERFI